MPPHGPQGAIRQCLTVRRKHTPVVISIRATEVTDLRGIAALSMQAAFALRETGAGMCRTSKI
jgi:hypothetical protein